jgi:hypothetical protein
LDNYTRPFVIEFEGLRVFADLGAERIFAAERDNKRIAVEIKGFGGKSKISEFEKALGQYDLYEMFIAELEPQRQLFLAVSNQIYEDFFDHPAIIFAVKKKKLKMMIFNQHSEEIVKWIN